MPARARRRPRAVLGVRVGVGQSSREETAARVPVAVEADAAMGIVAARWRAAALSATDWVSWMASAGLVWRADALGRGRYNGCIRCLGRDRCMRQRTGHLARAADGSCDAEERRCSWRTHRGWPADRRAAQQDLDDDQGSTAVPADEGGRALGGRLVVVDVDGLVASRGWSQQLFAHGGEAGATIPVGQQAVVPDAMQAGGQHVQ